MLLLFSQHNTRAQDKLFTRIADSYVALFCSVNPDIRDKFFAVSAVAVT